MKFVIRPHPNIINHLLTCAQFNVFLVKHLESIVKAQGELLERYRNSNVGSDEFGGKSFAELAPIDNDYDDLQQAIKEAK